MCYDLLAGRISEDDFKIGIADIINEYGHLGYICYQAIGLAIAKWSGGISEENKELVWKLADEVDPKIRKAFEHWVGRMVK